MEHLTVEITVFSQNFFIRPGNVTQGIRPLIQPELAPVQSLKQTACDVQMHGAGTLAVTVVGTGVGFIQQFEAPVAGIDHLKSGSGIAVDFFFGGVFKVQRIADTQERRRAACKDTGFRFGIIIAASDDTAAAGDSGVSGIDGFAHGFRKHFHGLYLRFFKSDRHRVMGSGVGNGGSKFFTGELSASHFGHHFHMTVAVAGAVKHPHIVIPQGEGGAFFAEHGDTIVDVVQKSLIQGAAAVGLAAVGFKDLVSLKIALGSQIPVTAVAESRLEKDAQFDFGLLFEQSLQSGKRRFLDAGLVVHIIPQGMQGIRHGKMVDPGLGVPFTDQLCQILFAPGKVGDDGNKKRFGERSCFIHGKNSFSNSFFTLREQVH